MRITESDLKSAVARLNKITNSPVEYSTDGKCNIGNYCLDWAYSGVQLQRVTSEGGAVDTVFAGFGTMRELHEKIQNFISGIEYTISQENPK